MRLISAFIVIVYALTACGVKGPLYLPPEGDSNGNLQKTKKK
ncbi:MAG TPA: lipoprotein [Nitrosomonas sp.]|nr:lipoprotein [Nitrosomonas sp.]HQX13999.1 lipoprotein [Nitrosomonas sp.]HRB21996.1 lipoprotein [Nitrosomonas sp.]HRB31796.1 lipoprotein [Nitrosomonas sp.]HRB44629.1 lipoprotein [Nitrosomonas sp.]